MSLQTASVSGSRLRLAMDLGGFATFAALDEASGVSSDTLRGWAKGRVERPSSQSREAIEDALPVTFEFLTDQAQMPQVHSVNFRSLRSADDHARSKLRAYMAVMAWVVQNILGALPCSIDSIHQIVGGAERTAGAVAAGQLRRRLGLGQSPIPDVIQLAESIGAVVAYGPRQTADLDACSARVGAHALIALNPAKGDYYRQRWDVAHELGHLVMHDREDRPESNRTREAQADGFAEGLLYPASNRAIRDLRNVLHCAHVDVDTAFQQLVAIQDEWGISVDAVLLSARRSVRDRAAKSAIDSLGKQRLTVAPKTAPVGGVRTPERPQLLPNAINDLATTSPMRAATVAFELGIKPEVLATMSATSPRDVRW